MKKVLLLLAEGFEFYEASVFIDVIGWNLVEGDHSTQLFSCGLRREIKSSFSQCIEVDYLVDEIEPEEFDALAIPGGFEKFDFYRDAYDEKFLEVIRKFNEKHKIIASVCVGALPIACSGILVNRKATTYNIKGIRQKELGSFGAIVVKEPIVTDDNVITSWNPSTAMEVAFQLLESLTSKENCDYIRGIMGFNPN